jgi:hypothetical protein
MNDGLYPLSEITNLPSLSPHFGQNDWGPGHPVDGGTNGVGNGAFFP